MDNFVVQLKTMFKTDKTLLFPIGMGSGAGGYVGFQPASWFSESLLQVSIPGDLFTPDRVVQLVCAVITTVIVTAVSFFVTMALKRIFRNYNKNN